MTTIKRLVALLLLAGSTLLIPAPGAFALSCAAPSDWMPDADHVFVGRITDVRGETMQVEVDEVWQGEDLARRVWLRRASGMDGWFPFSVEGRVPDGWSSPTEYVIATHEGFVVDPCGLWARSEPLEYGVPGERSPRPPAAAGASGVEPDERSAAPLVAGVGVAGAASLGVLALLRRRRVR